MTTLRITTIMNGFLVIGDNYNIEEAHAFPTKEQAMAHIDKHLPDSDTIPGVQAH